MDAQIFDAIRTPRGNGRPGGAFHGKRPIELVGRLLRATQERTGVDPDLIDDLLLGCVTQVGEQGANIARTAILDAGFSDTIPGATLNRFCTSGLDAVNLAAAKVSCGMESLILAGGVESMSRVPMMSDNGAWFADPVVRERTRFIHMGVAADLIASLYGVTRAEADAFAVRSHHRAAKAVEEHRFRSIIPVWTDSGEVAADERIRPEITVESLASRRPSFEDAGAAGADAVCLLAYPELAAVEHIHHSGSSPGMVDGASLVLVGTRAMGDRLGLRPRGRVRSWANAAVDPVVMLTAPIGATQLAVERAGITLGDVDAFEVNESFSATVLAWERALGVDPDKVNPNGGAIAMGHPLGATGGMLISAVLDELERVDGTFGLVTLCGGGGVGVATVIERV